MLSVGISGMFGHIAINKRRENMFNTLKHKLSAIALH